MSWWFRHLHYWGYRFWEMKWEKTLVSLDRRGYTSIQERTVDTPRPYARREHCTSQSYVRRGQWPRSRSGEDTPWSYMSGEGTPRSCVGMGENISIPKWPIGLWKDSWHAYARKEHCPSQSYVRRGQWPRSRSGEDTPAFILHVRRDTLILCWHGREHLDP